MGKPFDIDEKFLEWYNGIEGFGLRSERLEDDISLIRSGAITPEKRLQLIRGWLEAAYKQGAEDMANDTVDTLLDYGTAVAGLDEKVHNRTEAFDNSAENLKQYYEQVLTKGKKWVA